MDISSIILLNYYNAFIVLLYPYRAFSIYIPPYGERISPKPFTYQYGVNGSFSKNETQVVYSVLPSHNFTSHLTNYDSEGNVKGEVIISLPDGRVQTTKYKADYQKG